MKYPLTSFIASLFIWLGIFSFVGIFFSSEEKITKESITIDAKLISAPKMIEKNNFQKSSPLKSEIPKKVIEKNSSSISKNFGESEGAVLLSNPLPKIPEDLRGEAFESYAIARFHIAPDGSTTVELIKPCANPRLNRLLIQSLKQWKFSPEKKFGIPVASIKDIRVTFKVE